MLWFLISSLLLNRLVTLVSPINRFTIRYVVVCLCFQLTWCVLFYGFCLAIHGTKLESVINTPTGVHSVTDPRWRQRVFFLDPITVSFRSETSTRFQVKVHWIIETKIANRSLFLIPDFSFLFSLLRVSLFTLASNGPTVRILYILCVCVVLQVTTLVPL